MSAFDWESFLRRWSQAILELMSEDQLAQLPQDVIESGWLGYPGATEEQISQTESRLGLKFPPSYRAFLQVTNGWRQTTPFIHRLWSTEGIERFAVRHQKWIEAFTNQHENTQVSFEYAIELDDLWELTTVSDAEYFVYGEAQDCSKLRVEYLKTAIEISDVGEASIYLLNPQVVTEAGEWEAWFFGDWLPGADRYRSFQDMMEAEYHNFLELRDAMAVQNVACVTSDPPEMAEPRATRNVLAEWGQVVEDLTQQTDTLSSESPMEETPSMWRSLTRLIVEFQTRQIGEQLEYRTFTTVEGEQGNSWPGLEKRKLQQWLQTQLAGEITNPGSPIASMSRTTRPTTEKGAITSNLPQSAPDLMLEMEQLLIWQDSHLSASIVVNPAVLKQTKKRGYASLISEHPFSFEVVFNLVGQSISDLSTQAITYQVQFYVQNRMTGQWIALGETRPAHLGDQQTYKAYLFGSTLESGTYRLQVLTTLRGAAVAFTSFELPLLTIV